MVEDYKETIFKSSYWRESKLNQMFLNYGYNGYKTFSIMFLRQTDNRQKPFVLIHNLTEDEKIPFVKSILRQLSEEEKLQLFKEFIQS